MVKYQTQKENHKTRLLITGGAGFIGHHILEGILKATDWEVVILDALTYAGNLNRITDISIWEKEKHRVKFIWHNLQAPISETTHKMIGNLDYIWHLAAESHVERSLEDSIPFVMSNVVGTANLLEYTKKYQPDLKRFIAFSTDEVYGPAPAGVYYKEGDAHNPSNPYSASKSGQEAICRAFAYSHKIPITITNTMNVIGERQHPEKFLPKIVRGILNNEKIMLHGLKGKESSRCWIHARNVCDALFYINRNGEIITKEKQHIKGWGSYHIVGEERTVRQIADLVSEIIRERKMGEDEIDYVDFHSTRPGHDSRYAMSGEKLKKQGFKYQLTLDQSFEKMVRWMCHPDHSQWLNL